MPKARTAKPDCNMFNCFDMYRCGVVGRGGLKVYIYPPALWVTASGEEISPMSTEYYSMLEAIYSSPYYTPDPSSACIFIPSIDLLATSAFTQLRPGFDLPLSGLSPPSTPSPP